MRRLAAWSATALLGLAGLALVFGGGGCGNGDGATDPDGNATLVLAAGNQRLAPGATTVPGVDLPRVEVTTVTSSYDLTTPPGEPFVFDVISRSPANDGAVRVGVAHALDGGVTPEGGPASLAAAGVIASGPGRRAGNVWMEASGDGFARVTLRGAIERDQVLVVRGHDGDLVTTATVTLRLGPPSPINFAAQAAPVYPGLLDERTLYSSDSWMFGLPTIAVSGDRSSIVCYEGDRADGMRFDRYEMRLQYNRATDAVTGGASEETSPDSGNWRDHEIAALFNVLALVHSGDGHVTLKLSFDRGATFAQTETFGRSASGYSPRLVQIAMAADYSLAVLFWRVTPVGWSELILVEGRPSGVDGGGSPTGFAFDPERVLHQAGGDVSPTLMGATWSEGGDLVVGYAFTSFNAGPGGTWINRTQNRCAVRPWQGEFLDTLVEENVVVGRDPSVAVLGSGATLRIFYAYEAEDGVRLAASGDGGRTFSAPHQLFDFGASVPTVFARMAGPVVGVDLLYLTQAAEGTELHLRHWSDFDTLAPVDYRLTRAVTTGGGVPGPVPPVWGGGAPEVSDFKITQVAFFGYDAVLDGGEILIVYDEETIDGYAFAPLPLGLPEPGFAEGAPAAGDFTPADPPPLAPGLTEAVPPPDPLHRHQLRFMRLE